MSKGLKNLILIGGGGHCASCIDVIESCGQFDISGIIDLKEKIGEKILSYKIIDDDDSVEKYVSPETYFLITLGQIKSSKRRREIFALLDGLKANIATVVSPLARVAKSAAIGRGSIIMHYALVNARANVGQNCIINTRSLIEHDAIVGDCCHISTGAIVNGTSKIGADSFVGSGAVVVNNVDVPPNSFVKALSLFK